MSFARMRLLSILVWAAASPPSSASDYVLPSGFNLESVPAAGPLVAVLPDGSKLLSTGSFGADKLERLLPSGALVPWADGFGSLAGLALSPRSGDVVVGDSLGPTLLWLLRDLDGDGDMLDAGEKVPHPVQPPLLSNGAQPLPFDLTFRPGSDELYVSGSTPFGSNPLLGVVLRVADGRASVWADGLGLAGGLLWDGDDLYAADLDASAFVGRVLRLHDENDDGDALDPGESPPFASGLSGANDLVLATDGALYLSGAFDLAGDFSGSVARLLPDGDGNGLSDGVDETYFDGFVFTSTLHLFEGGPGFLPGVLGDGELVVGDFTIQGNRVIRSAPHAEIGVSGTVANNAVWRVLVGGAPGSGAFLVVSLDLTGTTVQGVGDLGAGFDGPFLVDGPVPVGPHGVASWVLGLHGQPALVGLPVVFQGAILEAGEIGLSAALDIPIQ